MNNKKTAAVEKKMVFWYNDDSWNFKYKNKNEGMILILRKWEDIPSALKNERTRYYYEILSKKKFDLFFKRVFDFITAALLLILLAPVFVTVAVLVKLTSAGPILYKQDRVTTYGKVFRIYKFRTMVENADKMGSLVTLNNDDRVTKLGRFLRRVRLDEIPQLFNIIFGQMSFVGTRPEVKKYVEAYSDEMLATLLMPAGVTSLACISFRDEDKHLDSRESTESTYINKILPEKMKYNLEYISKFNVFYDIFLMLKTVLAVVNIV